MEEMQVHMIRLETSFHFDFEQTRLMSKFVYEGYSFLAKKIDLLFMVFITCLDLCQYFPMDIIIYQGILFRNFRK